MLPFDGLRSECIQCMSQLACPRLPISDSKKKRKGKFGFQGKSRIVPNPAFFGQKCYTSEVHLVPVSLSPVEK